MRYHAPLPGDDDTPFPADDELFPSPGTTPRDAGNETEPDSLLGVWLLLGLLLAVFVLVAVAIAVRVVWLVWGGGA